MQNDLVQLVKAHFDSQNIKYNLSADSGILGFNITGTNLTNIDVKVLFHDDGFEVYAQAPFTVPADKRAAVAEFTDRVNFGTRIGNLEMNYDAGAVYHRAYLVADQCIPSRESVAKVCNFGILLMDIYGKGLSNLVFGGATPAQAAATAKGNG